MSKVRLDVSQDSYRITLTDPPLNIMDIEMLLELRALLDQVGSDRPLLRIEAEGEKAFSAGASVDDHKPEIVAEMLHTFHDCFRRLYRIGMVTVAVVKGSALGGGCELAMACDLVLASEDAKFGQPEIRLGVFPPVAAFQLARHVAPRVGFEMLITGEPISAQRAREVGLVNEVFPTDQLDAMADEWLERVTRNSSASLWFAKRAFRTASHEDFELRLAETERLYIQELMKTEDAREGIEAFLEKREPVWQGR